jgi:hypothetical protein
VSALTLYKTLINCYKNSVLNIFEKKSIINVISKYLIHYVFSLNKKTLNFSIQSLLPFKKKELINSDIKVVNKETSNNT